MFVNWAAHILKAAPETALFAALALGHALGKVKLGSFSLGGVAGSLLVALVLGQFTGVVLPDAVKAVCFALFIYAVCDDPADTDVAELKVVLDSRQH